MALSDSEVVVEQACKTIGVAWSWFVWLADLGLLWFASDYRTVVLATIGIAEHLWPWVAGSLRLSRVIECNHCLSTCGKWGVIIC